MFFGTPHRGSNTAELGKLLREIVNVVRRAPPNTVVNELRIDSPSLWRISENFKGIHRSLRLVSFYEQKPTSPANVMVSWCNLRSTDVTDHERLYPHGRQNLNMKTRCLLVLKRITSTCASSQPKMRHIKRLSVGYGD